MIYDEEKYNQVLAVARSYRNDVERLEKQLALTEKALELACDKIEDIYESHYVPAWFYGDGNNEIIARDKFEEYFKTKAKEMLENE